MKMISQIDGIATYDDGGREVVRVIREDDYRRLGGIDYSVAYVLSRADRIAAQLDAPKEWTEVDWEQAGDMTATLYQRGDRWRCVATLSPYDSTDYGSKETEGRGDSANEAVEVCRRDVFAWAEDSDLLRADYATTLRKLVYDAEDAEHGNDDD